MVKRTAQKCETAFGQDVRKIHKRSTNLIDQLWRSQSEGRIYNRFDDKLMSLFRYRIIILIKHNVFNILRMYKSMFDPHGSIHKNYYVYLKHLYLCRHSIFFCIKLKHVGGKIGTVHDAGIFRLATECISSKSVKWFCG